MTSEDRVQFLQGQIQALTSFCFFLIETHPDPSTLRARLPEFLEAGYVKISGMPVDEMVVEGLEDMKGRLLAFAASAAERRARP